MDRVILPCFVSGLCSKFQPFCCFFQLITCHLVTLDHLIGVGGVGKKAGHKTKLISSMTRCKVHISPQKPMKIVIASNSAHNVERAIGMIQESLVGFLSDESLQKRLLFELALFATGSYKIQRDDSSKLLLHNYDGQKKWCALFNLPTSGKTCHGNFVTSLKLPAGNHSSIEVFGDKKPLRYAEPYVLISGPKKADVKVAVSWVDDVMRRHQQNCGCKPKW